MPERQPEPDRAVSWATSTRGAASPWNLQLGSRLDSYSGARYRLLIERVAHREDVIGKLGLSQPLGTRGGSAPVLPSQIPPPQLGRVHVAVVAVVVPLHECLAALHLEVRIECRRPVVVHIAHGGMPDLSPQASIP